MEIIRTRMAKMCSRRNRKLRSRSLRPPSYSQNVTHALEPRTIRKFINLGEIGYVRSIEVKLDELAETPGNADVVTALRDRIQAFDFAGYSKMLEGLNHAE